MWSIIEHMILEFKRKIRERNINLGVKSILMRHQAMRLNEIYEGRRRMYTQRG